jgi:Imelysin
MPPIHYSETMRNTNLVPVRGLTMLLVAAALTSTMAACGRAPSGAPLGAPNSAPPAPNQQTSDGSLPGAAAVDPSSGDGAVLSPDATAQIDMSSVRAHVLAKTGELKSAAAAMNTASAAYYDLAKGADFNYGALLKDKRDGTVQALSDARAAWMQAVSAYSKMEGIVAGTPTLADFDLILDAGSSAKIGGDGVVPFDLNLPDGRTLSKPGNLFGVTEGALWGTVAEFSAKGTFDIDGDGKPSFGDALPDANVLIAASNEIVKYAAELEISAQSWQPNEREAFIALLIMAPSAADYLDAWKQSRFVAGDASTRPDYAALSRLSDLNDMMSGLQVLYAGVSPLVSRADAASDAAVIAELGAIKQLASDALGRENAGARYSATEAEKLIEQAAAHGEKITITLIEAAGKVGVKIEQ